MTRRDQTYSGVSLYNFAEAPITETPEPATAMPLGTGLAAMGWLFSRSRRRLPAKRTAFSTGALSRSRVLATEWARTSRPRRRLALVVVISLLALVLAACEYTPSILLDGSPGGASSPSISSPGERVLVQASVVLPNSGIRQPTGTVTFTPVGNVAPPEASCTGTLGQFADGTAAPPQHVECYLVFTQAGTRTVEVRYGGDTGVAGDDVRYTPTSALFTHQVGQGAASLNMVSPSAGARLSYTEPVTASLRVVNLGDHQPTGSVTFVEDLGGACTAAASVAADASTFTCALTIGNGQVTASPDVVRSSHIKAYYTGDAYLKGGSTTLAVEAGPGSVHTTIASALPVVSVVKQNVTVAGTVSADQVILVGGEVMQPTGRVEVSGAGGACSAVISAGQWSCSLQTFFTGTITAQYTGDLHFAADHCCGRDGVALHAVDQAPTTLSVTANPGVLTIGQPETFTATVTVTGNPSGALTPAELVPLGTITFSEGPDVLGTADALPVTATTTVAILTTQALTRPGSHIVTATYRSAPGFHVASQGTVTVQPPAAAPPPAPVITAPAAALSTTSTIVLVAGNAAPNAAVMIYDGATVAATVQADAAGNFSTNLTLPVGINSLAAAQTVDGVLGPASSAVVVTITAAAGGSTAVNPTTLTTVGHCYYNIAEWWNAVDNNPATFYRVGNFCMTMADEQTVSGFEITFHEPLDCTPMFSPPGSQPCPTSFAANATFSAGRTVTDGPNSNFLNNPPQPFAESPCSSVALDSWSAGPTATPCMPDTPYQFLFASPRPVRAVQINFDFRGPQGGEPLNNNFTWGVVEVKLLAPAPAVTLTDPPPAPPAVGGSTPTLNGTPADITAEATAPYGARVSYALPTATDPVDGAVPVSCLPSSGSPFYVGTSWITCTATNVAGLSAQSSFTITVRDTIPPILHLPTVAPQNATGPGGAVVSFAATATDTVSQVTPVCTPASGSPFPAGTSTVACTATDLAGNTAQGTFNVTVSGLTSTGSDINVTPVDPATGTSPLSLTFSSITSPGETYVTSYPAGLTPPLGYGQLLLGDTFYEVSTTASFSGPVAVCITSPLVTTRSRLLHYDSGAWEDRTVTPVSPPEICAKVTSLSPFALVQDTTAPEAVIGLGVLGQDTGSGIALSGLVGPTCVSPPSKAKDDKGRGGQGKGGQGNSDDRDHDVGDAANGSKAQVCTSSVTDRAGNSTTVVALVRQSGRQADVSVRSVQYGGAPAIAVGPNSLSFEWSLDKRGNIHEMEEKVSIGSGAARVQVTAHYGKGKTEIRGKGPKARVSKPGVVVVSIATSNGELSLDYGAASYEYCLDTNNSNCNTTWTSTGTTTSADGAHDGHGHGRETNARGTPTYVEGSATAFFGVTTPVANGIFDFDELGAWTWNRLSGWVQITGNDPSSLEPWNDDVVVDYGAAGTWLWTETTGAWAQLTAADPAGLAACGEYLLWEGAIGTWRWDHDTGWQQLTGAIPDRIACLGGKPTWANETAGTLVYDVTTGATQITVNHPDDMRPCGTRLVWWAGGIGTWVYEAAAGWTQIAEAVPDSVACYQGNIAWEGADGTWLYDVVSQRWTRLAVANPDRILAWGEKLVWTSETSGTWIYDSASGWTQITANHPTQLASLGSDLLWGGPGGTWVWTAGEGGGWTRIAGAVPSQIVSTDVKR